MPQSETILELTVHDQIANGAVGAAVRTTIAALGFRAERAARVGIVVEELVGEARAREPFALAPDTINIAIDLHGDVVAIAVTDYRMPVNSAQTHKLPSRRLAAMKFIDRLHITNHGKAGNVAECQIRFDDQAAAIGHEIAQLDATVEQIDPAETVSIREMTAADVDGFVRLIFRCYGYSYADESSYQPATLRRLLRSGLMISVVAVSSAGEVVGHAAMTFANSHEHIPEAGRFVVDPRYRGHHLAERLAEARAEIAVQKGIRGLWAECVTNHAASQLNIRHLGGHEVGFLIGADPPNVLMAGLAHDTQGRLALLAMYTPIIRGKEVLIHAPAHLSARFASLAERLSLHRRVASEVVAATGTTRLTVEVNPSMGVAHLRVSRIGADLVRHIASEIGSLIAFELGALYVDISLADPHAPWAIDELEQLGFCWATWIPHAHTDGDVLRLQRIGEHSVDVQHVVTASPHGQEMVAWVLAEWERVRRRQRAPQSS